MCANIDKSIRTIALETLELEKRTIEHLIQAINDSFEHIVHFLHRSSGKLIITGVGKSAIIGKKIVATLNSTGTVAVFMHAGDAIHGDLGIIEKEDTVLCISKSGNTPEIKLILNIIQNFGNKIIGMSSNPDSHLGRQADFFLWTPVDQEADPHNLAPTCSTIAQMAMGDALAVSLSYLKNFRKEDFAKYHPGGILGKELYTKVSHLIHLHEKPAVKHNEGIENVIIEISEKRLGATVVLDENEKITGIITDGDLRRMLMKNKFSAEIKAEDIMTASPVTIDEEELATQAIQRMQKHSITQLVVVKDDLYTGMIHLHDLLKEGLTIEK